MDLVHEFTVCVGVDANYVRDVKATSIDDAIETAQGIGPVGLCHQCGGTFNLESTNVAYVIVQNSLGEVVRDTTRSSELERLKEDNATLIAGVRAFADNKPGGTGWQARVAAREAALELATAAESKPVCSVCNDTHRMRIGGQTTNCTACPEPCRKCRGEGFYCKETPCGCACHG